MPQLFPRLVGQATGELMVWALKKIGEILPMDFNSKGAAHVDYEYVTGGMAEDWMVTPLVAIPNGPTFSLTYYEKQTDLYDYGSQYYIKVSTTSQTDRATFTDIINYGETSFGTQYRKRSIDLSAYAGQGIYVAFVLVQKWWR